MNPARILSVLCLLVCAGPVSANYIITPTSGGAAALIVSPGETFPLEIGLSSNASDAHNSSIFRVLFSSGGLTYNSYEWKTPYANGTTDDDSKPLNNTLPKLLAADTLTGVAYPAGVVDVELSNVIDSGTFGHGTLVTLTLGVPANYTGPETVTISVVSDTIASGFTEVPTAVGSDFVLTITPEPASLWLLAFGGLGLMRSRRRS